MIYSRFLCKIWVRQSCRNSFRDWRTFSCHEHSENRITFENSILAIIWRLFFAGRKFSPAFRGITVSVRHRDKHFSTEFQIDLISPLWVTLCNIYSTKSICRRPLHVVISESMSRKYTCSKRWDQFSVQHEQNFTSNRSKNNKSLRSCGKSTKESVLR